MKPGGVGKFYEKKTKNGMINVVLQLISLYDTYFVEILESDDSLLSKEFPGSPVLGT